MQTQNPQASQDTRNSDMEINTAVQFPKVAIRFCVQCKWNLRAAYYAQELLQTFSNTIGEVSLIPVTGGIFNITLYTNTNGTDERQQTVSETLIWDRKRDGGFPETKELKNRVRNVIDPEKDMGHVDRALKKSGLDATTGKQDHAEETNVAVDQATIPAGHTQHKTSSTPEGECEECREAAREDTADIAS